MKKTLLAAALTVGFFGVAQAETSVTLYGILDGGIGYSQVKGTPSYLADGSAVPGVKSKQTGMINGVQYGNRWGLKGAEDLGNGLRAVFQLESGFDLGTGFSQQGLGSANNGGEGRLFGRQATLGLASDAWGQLDVGRQTNIASKYLAGAVSPFGASFGQANSGAVFSQANTARYDNMVMYQTPNFSGFQFGVGYSFNVNGSQARTVDIDGAQRLEGNQRGITTGLRYANGPINVALTYDQFKDREVLDGADVEGGDTVKAWALGGSYDFEIVKVYAGFGQTTDGFFQAQGYSNISDPAGLPVAPMASIEGLKFNSYSLGVSAPLGNGTLMAGWMMADPRSTPNAWGEPGEPAREMDKQQTYSIGYTYDISKRTNLYAIGSYAKHVYFLPDAKSTLVGVGLVHKF